MDILRQTVKNEGVLALYKGKYSSSSSITTYVYSVSANPQEW